MRDTPEWRMEWLQRHKNAEVIVTDLQGNLVRAEYRTLSGGRFPVAYSYPEDEGENLSPQPAAPSPFNPLA